MHLCLQPQCKIHIGMFSSTSYCTGICTCIALLVGRLLVVGCRLALTVVLQVQALWAVRFSVVDCSTLLFYRQKHCGCMVGLSVVGFTGTSTEGGQTFSRGLYVAPNVIFQVQVLLVARLSVYTLFSTCTSFTGI